MKKFLLGFILISGIACAKENCSLIGIDKDRYRDSYITEYKFQCTGIKGYDYVEHSIFVKFSSLKSIKSSYYIDGIERKNESFCIFENENEDGTYEMIGYVDISLYDEFHIEIKDNYNYTSRESMEKTLVNKWNRLKKFIPKYSLKYNN